MPQPKPLEREALELIKQLLYGTILATYDVQNLDNGTTEPGLPLEQAFEQQWKFIEPKLADLVAERSRPTVCEVCRQRTVTRKGVEYHDTMAITFGYFCDECIAYPGLAASKSDYFEIVELEGRGDA